MKHGRCETNKMPLSLAENLCIPCATQTVREGRTKTPAQKVAKAWGLVELALASKDAKIKQDTLASSSQLVGRALAQKSAPTGHANARLLQSFIPSFTDRANHPSPTAASRRYANLALGELLLWRYETHMADNAGWSAEALVLYLMSREGIPGEDFLLAGSPREETNTNKPRLNHDAYQLWPDGSGNPSKFPVQIKNKHTSGYDVPVLAVVSTLRPVLETLGTNSIEPIMSMAAFESAGKTGSHQETVLDFASHCIQAALTTSAYRSIISEMSQG